MSMLSGQERWVANYRTRFNEEPWCGFFNPYTNKIKIMARDRDELWADLKCREIDIYEV